MRLCAFGQGNPIVVGPVLRRQNNPPGFQQSIVLTSSNGGEPFLPLQFIKPEEDSARVPGDRIGRHSVRVAVAKFLLDSILLLLVTFVPFPLPAVGRLRHFAIQKTVYSERVLVYGRKLPPNVLTILTINHVGQHAIL